MERTKPHQVSPLAAQGHITTYNANDIRTTAYGLDIKITIRTVRIWLVIFLYVTIFHGGQPSGQEQNNSRRSTAVAVQPVKGSRLSVLAPAQTDSQNTCP